MRELGIRKVLRLETEREYKQCLKVPRNRGSYVVGSSESARATLSARKRPSSVTPRYRRNSAGSGGSTRHAEAARACRVSRARAAVESTTFTWKAHVIVVVSTCVSQYSRAVWVEV